MASYQEMLLRMVRRGFDFTDRQKCVLFAVRDEQQTVRGMAVHLNVSKPAITRAVNRLVIEGYALRKEDITDRRSIFVKITPAGRKVLATIEKDAD